MFKSQICSCTRIWKRPLTNQADRDSLSAARQQAIGKNMPRQKDYGKAYDVFFSCMLPFLMTLQIGRIRAASQFQLSMQILVQLRFSSRPYLSKAKLGIVSLRAQHKKLLNDSLEDLLQERNMCNEGKPKQVEEGCTLLGYR